MSAQQFREGDLVSIEGVVRKTGAGHISVKVPGMPGEAWLRPSEAKLVSPVLKPGDRVLVDTGGTVDARGTVIAAIPGFAWIEIAGDPIPRSFMTSKVRRVEIVGPAAAPPGAVLLADPARPAPFRYVEAEEGEH